MTANALGLLGRRIGFGFLAVGALLALQPVPGVLGTGAARADDPVTLSFDTQGAYTMGAGDTKALAQRLALFRAKRKAIYQAADEFTRRRLIQFVDRDKDELVSLVADRLEANPTQDQCRNEGQTVTCTVRAQTVVRLSDFISAQLASLQLGSDEDEQGYRDEMEPRVPDPLPPGRALAKVYRLIDKKEFRMAIIYLDRLAEHYPNWWEIYELKSMVLGLQNRPARMLEAVRKACELGSAKACAELK